MSPVPDFFYLKVMLGSVECFLELDDLLRHLVLGPGLPDRSGLARDRQLLSVCLDCLSHLNIVSQTLGLFPLFSTLMALSNFSGISSNGHFTGDFAGELTMSDSTEEAEL